MLRITVSEEEKKVRITVEGELSGDLARVLEANWRKAAPLHKRKPRVVDLCGVTFIDAVGKEVLRLMIDDGAEFVVSGPKTAYIIETLRGECKRHRAAREAERLSVIGAILLLLALTLMAAGTARAQQTKAPPLTRDEAVRIALLTQRSTARNLS